MLHLDLGLQLQVVAQLGFPEENRDGDDDKDQVGDVEKRP